MAISSETTANTIGEKTGKTEAGKLSAEQYSDNFSDLHTPLTRHEALVEADRCYFCHDAPCMTACPTSIDIPLFIREILTDNPKGSAKTIFMHNILGGMCARVCPTETLCEQVCVRETAEGKPVKIGQLQRYATDHFLQNDDQPFERAAATGKKVAIVGAGPAGLSCAHRLAMHGHDVVIKEALPKPGGLNEYGIASYKTVEDFAQKEVAFVLSIGGITVENDQALGKDYSLQSLCGEYDAVFLGLGLSGTGALGMAGEDLAGITDAVDFIAELRQSEDVSKIPVGRNVVVIGGGMTAVDAAVQAKLLGAEDVTIAYRRGQDRMSASAFEQELAQINGVTIRNWVQPSAASGEGRVASIELECTTDVGGGLAGTGEKITIQADQVLKAIGQNFVADPVAGEISLELEKGRIKVDDDRKSSHRKIWAGGDCIAGGEDLTVTAVEDGKVAAESINVYLGGGQ